MLFYKFFKEYGNFGNILNYLSYKLQEKSLVVLYWEKSFVGELFY